MTQEEKAKAYDEAIKRANELLYVSDKESLQCKIIESILPELAESEDEKIRNSIIHHIKFEIEHNIIPSERATSWIAYIEKQGKQETLCDKCKKEQPSHSCQDITELGRCALEKQGEQKPTDLKTWKYIVDAVLTEREGIGQYIDSPWTTYVAEKLQKRFGNIEQKPVNTSISFDTVTGVLRFDNLTLEQAEAIRKALFGKQKHVEWSKEDDKMIDSIAVHLNATTSGFPEERAWADRFMNWLKSLKDRINKG